MRKVLLALVAIVPFQAQACDGTYRGTMTQQFGQVSQDGDIELVVSAGKVDGFAMGHIQKIKRPISGTVDGACKLDAVMEGTSGKFALTGSLTEGTGKSMGSDAFRLKYTMKRAD